MTTTNNSMKPIKEPWARERYGAYGYIYYKHANNQRIKYGILLQTYRELRDIPKECIGKSKKYI